jgi:micrococcal nuclease
LEERVRVFANVFRRIAALPIAAKVLIAIAAIIALGLSVLLSPLIAVVAFLMLLVAIFAMILRALQRRPMRNWGLIALTSFLLVVVFTGIASALYGGSTPQQASSPEPMEVVEQEAPAEEAEEASLEVQQETPVEEAEEASLVEEIIPPDEAQDERSGYDTTVRVTRVVDGDTVEISPAIDGIEDVRLIGVDTPETRDPDCGVQPYGDVASAFTQAQLSGQQVELEFDVEKTDRYDRLLAYVYEDGEMFNETLLEEGYAQVATFTPNVKYVDPFLAAQEEARVTALGMWGLSSEDLSAQTDHGNGIGAGGCEQPQTAQPQQETQQPQAPSSEQDLYDCGDFQYQEDAQAVYEQDQSDPYGLDGPQGEASTGTPGVACEELPNRTPNGTRQQRDAPRPSLEPTPTPPPPPSSSSGRGGSSPPVSGNACPSEAPIKGNQSGIYHVPGGQSYDRTNPEECFASEEEAQAAGYRKAER